MESSYSNGDRSLIAVDCIIFGFDNQELKLLLIKRSFEPEKGKWSLMGGFLKKDETLDHAAERVLHELTGLEEVYLEQSHVFSQVSRDPVERTVSVTYYALINIKEHIRELNENYSAQWFKISELPPLIFDHDLMVREAIEKLRYRISIKPIGFELLPEKFTMKQLQNLYEIILNQELDKRNFSKKILSLDLLIKLDEKDMNSSRKGSFLFRFDQEKYQQKIKQGFTFKL